MLSASGLYPGEGIWAVLRRRARRLENQTYSILCENSMTIFPDHLRSTLIAVTHLYSGLAELRSLAELLPGVDVRVLGPLECLLQLVQLVGGEGGAGPPLLPLERDPGLRLSV